MWISENMKFGGAHNFSAGAELGEISLDGAKLAAVTQGERRELKMSLPGGVSWRPKVGQRVLVLTTAEGEAIVAGAIKDADSNLDAETLLLESGDTVLKLSKSGLVISGRNICLEGNVDIVGDLSVNGEGYKPCSCTGVI